MMYIGGGGGGRGVAASPVTGGRGGGGRGLVKGQNASGTMPLPMLIMMEVPMVICG